MNDTTETRPVNIPVFESHILSLSLLSRGKVRDSYVLKREDYFREQS